MRRDVPQRRRGRDDRGITTIVVALLLTVILMFVALAIDGGGAYVSHRRSQNSSDAGAYAGVRVLDHLKFDGNCEPTITASCPFTSNADIATAVMNEATSSGAAAASMHCYLVTFSGARVVDPSTGTTHDLCSGGVAAAATANEVALAYGVEADATVNRTTDFARAVSALGSTSAATKAIAIIQSYVATQGVPFVVCGSTSDQTSSYDILARGGTSPNYTYTVKTTALSHFYVLESSAVPSCGAGSASFNGLAGGESVSLNQWNNTTPGNGNSGTVFEQIVGATPCTTQQISSGQFNGCGVLIPIATQNQSNGQNTSSYLVMWTVWAVWGDGTAGYKFNQVPGVTPTGQQGNSCNNPLVGNGGSTSGMKYCGEMLGSYSVIAGGAGGGPPTFGSARVFHLIT
jgi:hypothetical protein